VFPSRIADDTLTEYSASWIDHRYSKGNSRLCGFVGGTNPAWNFSRALDTIAHRGPDDSQLLQSDTVTFGFRRLAVIDLNAAANQPMQDASGNLCLVFNGEIYGFRALRHELRQRGAEFRSHCDTEVVLQAYAQWGDTFIERIDGMFAIVLWDARERRCRLYRDRAGIKPLYYYFDGKHFAFASELKALEAAIPAELLEVDNTSLYDFLGYRYVPAPKSLYTNVFKLEPGHTVVFDYAACRLSAPQRYWHLEPTAAREITLPEACEELRSLIDQSVSDQLIADVPVGFFLSGGVDSSVVVASAALQGADVQTFSIGFDSDAVSETPFARRVAEQFRTNHVERILSRDAALNLLPRLKQWFDEPFADESAMPTWLVSATAREHVTVVLTGDGGDEVFGGYRTYPRFERYEKWPRWPKSLEQLSWKLRAGAHRRSARSRLLQLLEMGFSSGPGLWARIMGGMPTPAKARWRERLEIPDDYEDWWHYSAHWRDDLPLRTRLQYVDFHTFMPGLVLTKVDRTSMAVSLEARVPLLDRRIIEFAFSLPEAIRLPDGEPKGLLREAYRGILPDEILDRRKKGFGIPRYYLGNLGDGIPVQEHILNTLFM
jgi:asparagine synthase (glutamine-hydrolysing)